MKTLLAALLTATFLAAAVPARAADEPAGDKTEKKDKKTKDKKGDKADKKTEGAPAGGGW